MKRPLEHLGRRTDGLGLSCFPPELHVTGLVKKLRLATELNCRVADEQPTTWPEVVSLGAGVAQGILDDEPKQDSRPWAWGCEPEESWEEWRESVTEVRHCKHRRLAWLGFWGGLRGGMPRPNRSRTKPIRAMLSGLL